MKVKTQIPRWSLFSSKESWSNTSWIFSELFRAMVKSPSRGFIPLTLLLMRQVKIPDDVIYRQNVVAGRSQALESRWCQTSGLETSREKQSLFSKILNERPSYLNTSSIISRRPTSCDLAA